MKDVGLSDGVETLRTVFSDKTEEAWKQGERREEEVQVEDSDQSGSRILFRSCTGKERGSC